MSLRAILSGAAFVAAQSKDGEAISSLKQGIASTEEHRLAMTSFLLRIAGEK
jgi:hypothetical protein